MPSQLMPTFSKLAERLHGAGPKLPSLSLSRSRGHRPSAGQTVVGLDIEPSHVVAAEVRVNGSLSLERAAGMPLAPEIVRDGEVVDVEALSGALRQIFTENKFDRRVRVGLANQRIMVRTLEVPPIADRSEFAAAVRFRAQDEIPMPLDQVVLDFHSLGVSETPAGARERVLLVAARRDMVDRLLAAVHGAGLRAEGIDLSAFALIRALRPAGSDPDERVLYLSLGGLTNLAVAEGQNCLFTRVLGAGLESMATTVAERCAIPVIEARTLIQQSGLLVPPTAPAAPAIEPVTAPMEPSEPDASAPEAATEATRVGEPAAPEAARPESPDSVNAGVARHVLTDGLRQIAAEIRNSLDYHLALGPGSSVTRVVASGPALEVPGLRQALEAELGLQVTPGEVAEIHPGASGDVPLNRVSVAAGLAVTEVPA